MKNLFLICIFILTTSVLFAQQKEKTYKVLASCATCNFNMQSNTGCTLAVQIGGKHYWVDGSKLQDHGDEHASDGMCNTTRKAEVVGVIIQDTIKTSSFVLLSEKKKKKKKKRH